MRSTQSLLTTGRMLYHYNTRAMTKRTEGLNEICSESYIEVNGGRMLRPLASAMETKYLCPPDAAGLPSTARVGQKSQPAGGLHDLPTSRTAM